MLNFLATLILAAVPTIEVSAAPLQPGLPQYVQELPAEEYEAWANWQNQLAKEKAKEDTLFSIEQPTYTVDRRITRSRTGGRSSSMANGTSSRQTSRGKNNSRTTASTDARVVRSQQGWRASTTAMISSRYKNPYYCPEPLVLYNPYVKSTSDLRPDWDNLFVPLNDRVLTVGEAMTMVDRPMLPETMFRLLMMPRNVINIQ